MDFYFLLMCLIMVGLGIWLLLAMFNNVVDPNTNIKYLGEMISMDLLKDDFEVGLGLRCRTMSRRYLKPILTIITLYQFIVVIFLLYASSLWFESTFDCSIYLRAIKYSNVALILFIGLWFAFMVGGLWFGYWIKQGAIQQVHMTLLIIGILVSILNNIFCVITAH